MALTLEQVIRNNITLSPRPNGRGFFSVLCKVCNDHGKKGKRGGFKFEGDTVGYNCFNCGHSAGYDPEKHRSTMPHSMVTVLDAFGVDPKEWEQVTFDVFMADRPAKDQDTPAPQAVSINPREIELPFTFYPLRDDKTNEWAQYAIEYLTQRKIDWQSYPFHLAEKSKDPDYKRWYGRLIIPVFKDGRVIFWQGRDLTDTMMKKYLSCSEPRDKVVYGYDHIFEHTEEPLYIMEGWFDAFALKGVATFGNKLTPEQIKWINRSTRPKVYIPDRFGDGHIAAIQALEEGWAVSCPEWGADTKDVNDSIRKYGELFTRMALKRGTHEGFAAEVEIGLYCKNDRSKAK